MRVGAPLTQQGLTPLLGTPVPVPAWTGIGWGDWRYPRLEAGWLRGRLERIRECIRRRRVGRVNALAERPESASDRKDRELIESYTNTLQDLAVRPVPAGMAGIHRQLTEEFPWMTELLQWMTGDLLLRQGGNRVFSFPPLLLVGEPGAGKTRFARRLAELVGVGAEIHSLATVSDDRDFSGSSRGWGSALPSAPVSAMARFGEANPLMVLDELDKAGGSDRNGDIRQALLTATDPETNFRWRDPYLRVAVDISRITWVFTANEVGPISQPLRERLTPIEVPLPGRAHYPVIIRAAAEEVRADYALPEEAADLPLAEVERIAARARNPRDAHRRTREAVKRRFLLAIREGAESEGMEP